MDYSFADKFYTIGERLHRLMTQHVHLMAISKPEFFAMQTIAILKEKKQKINTAGLSEALGVSKSAISQTMNSIEEKGYITRTIDCEDRRQPMISLTDAGKEALMRGRESIYQNCMVCLDRFGKEKTEQFLTLLEELTTICEEQQKQLMK